MSAKVLSEREFKMVLEYVAAHSHASRNRAMLLMTHLAGMRVGEVAAVTITDVLNSDGSIKDEIFLVPQNSNKRGRTVLLPAQLQQEIQHYLSVRFRVKDLATINFIDTNRALFNTQKQPIRGFTSGTLSQHFHYLYRAVGIKASSHSGRRGFITSLAKKGVNVRVLRALVGHTRTATTGRYFETHPAMMRTAVEMIT